MYRLTRLTGWPSDDLSDTFIDGYLQFGLTNACEIFNRIGRAIMRMMARRGFKCVTVGRVSTARLLGMCGNHG
jgi:hypothetical protein